MYIGASCTCPEPAFLRFLYTDSASACSEPLSSIPRARAQLARRAEKPVRFGRGVTTSLRTIWERTRPSDDCRAEKGSISFEGLESIAWAIHVRVATDVPLFKLLFAFL